MADTSFTLSGPDLDALLGHLGERARQLDYSRPFRTIAFYLAAQARLCFDQGVSPEGIAWAPLKNPSKRRGLASPLPLRDTGILFASLTGRSAGNVEQIQGATLTWGTSLVSKKGYPYPAVHQWGSRTTPARPFLGITEQMKTRIRLIVIDWLEKEVQRLS